MPMVRSPCTLECPRTGHSPAPGRPSMPRSSWTLTISRMAATESRRWVRPIAQQTMVAGESANSRAVRSIAARVSPVAASTDGPVQAPVRRTRRSPRCASWTNSWSTAPHSTQQRADRPEQGQVAADPDLQVVVGQVGAVADHPAHRLRVAEVEQPGLGQRVHRDDAWRRPAWPAPARSACAGGWCPGSGRPPRSASAGVDVVEGDAALADADGLGERQPGRLVAHVGAVGQVVRPVRAGQQLPAEGGLVGGTAGGVEDRLVRAGQRAQPGRRSARTRRPSRSGGSGRRRRPAASARPAGPAGRASGRSASARSLTGCAAKNSAPTRRRVASSATALAPFSQNSKCDRCPAAGSGQAQPGQSNPSVWLTRNRVSALRRRPICRLPAARPATTPATPAAAVFGGPVRRSRSPTSCRGALFATPRW